MNIVGAVTLNVGLAKSVASGGAIVTALSACYPVLTMFLALKNLIDERRLLPLTGAVLGVVGVVILALS